MVKGHGDRKLDAPSQNPVFELRRGDTLFPFRRVRGRSRRHRLGRIWNGFGLCPSQLCLDLFHQGFQAITLLFQIICFAVSFPSSGSRFRVLSIMSPTITPPGTAFDTICLATNPAVWSYLATNAFTVAVAISISARRRDILPPRVACRFPSLHLGRILGLMLPICYRLGFGLLQRAFRNQCGQNWDRET